MHRRGNLRSAQGMATVALTVMIVLTPGASADDRPEKQESACAQRVRSGADAHSNDHQNEGPSLDSGQQEGGKKRGLFWSWLRMGEQTQANQPDWLSPLVTTSGRLKQEFRYDIWDQPTPGGNRTYQFGGNKGLEFITSPRTQVLVGVPSYTLVSPNGPPGGLGDLPLMLKFRVSSAERGEGNYLLTFLLGATVPTGAHRNGAGSAVLTPTLAFGKGWGRFDTQSTFGASLPAGDTARLGRQVQWNTALQYQAAWKLWPELEVNSAFYETGKYAGDKQVFLTPGVGFGRIRLVGRFRFSSAVGMQIAVTRFHAYNHRWVFSQRFSF